MSEHKHGHKKIYVYTHLSEIHHALLSCTQDGDVPHGDVGACVKGKKEGVSES